MREIDVVTSSLPDGAVSESYEASLSAMGLLALAMGLALTAALFLRP